MSVPIARLGVPYATRLPVPRLRTSRYTYRALGSLPRGLRLSASGLLTGTSHLAAGQWVFEVGMAPTHGSAGEAMALRVDLGVVGPGTVHPSSPGMFGDGVGWRPTDGGAIDLGGAGPFGGAAGALGAGRSRSVSSVPLLSGRIGCWNMPGCNSSPTAFGPDAGGHALTQWMVDGLADQGCTSPNGNQPQWVVNTASGVRIGAYIDNEVDAFDHGTEQRQFLVDCVYAQGYGVILVGLYPSESSTYFLLPNDHGFAGGMLEWYPFCDGGYLPGYADFSRYPPPLEHVMASGYIVQDQYDNECTVGASPAQHQSEWSNAWREVNNDGGDGIYNDLIAGY